VSDQDLRGAAQKKQAYFDKQSEVAEPVEPRRGEIVRFKKVQNG